MRDEYTPDDPVFLDWKAGAEIDPRERWGDWLELAGSTVARGVELRRLRIVSEPVTPFIRYEWDLTEGLNLAAGESVRWLPRGRASDLMLPGNDLWVFDDHLVEFNLFAGDGTYVGQELSRAPAVIRSCVAAFERAWERGIDHAEYKPS